MKNIGTIIVKVIKPWTDLGMRFYPGEIIHVNAAEYYEAIEKNYDLVGVGLIPYHRVPLSHIQEV
jgi:hypothetical protein